MHSSSIACLIQDIDRNIRNTASLDGVIAAINEFQQDPRILDPYLQQWIIHLTEAFFTKPNEIQSQVCDVFYNLAKVCSWKKVCKYLRTDISALGPILHGVENVSAPWKHLYLLLSWLYVLLQSPFPISESDHIILLVSKFDSLQGLQSIIAKIRAEIYLKNPSQLKASSLLQWNEILKISVNTGHFDLVALQDLLAIVNKYLNDTPDLYMVKILPKLIKLFIHHSSMDSVNDIVSWIFSHMDSNSTNFRFALAHSFSKIISIMLKDFTVDGYPMIFGIIKAPVLETAQMVMHTDVEQLNTDLLHTQLLFIAETMPYIVEYTPELCKDIINCIIPKTSQFQQKRLEQIKGSHIKDASNFICWSMARCRKISSEYMEQIFLYLLISSLFDRDLLIRKSANAALQEVLGRYGNSFLDRTSVVSIIELPFANLNESYGSNLLTLYQILSPSKTKYFNFIIDWFIDFNILQNHDINIVMLSVQSLASLLSNESSVVEMCQIQSKILTLPTATSPLVAARYIYLTIELSQHLNSILSLTEEWVEIVTTSKKTVASTSFQHIVLLKYYIFCIEQTEFQFDENKIDNLFHIARSVTESSKLYPLLCKLFQDIVALISIDNNLLGRNEALFDKKLVSFIMHNNSMVSSSLPKLNHSKFIKMLYQSLPKIDPYIKSRLIDAMAPELPAIITSTSITHLDTIVELLDDYTTTEQGDIGRLVRTSVCKLIIEHERLFRETNTELAGKVRNKLIRLAAEPFNDLRKLSLQALCQFYKVEYNKNMNHNECVIKFWKTELDEGPIDFWVGFIMSAGAINSTDIEITSAVDAFLGYYGSLGGEDKQLDLLNCLIRLIPSAAVVQQHKKIDHLKDPITGSVKRDTAKFAVTCLTFWRRLFESNISIPAKFNFQGVYSKLYNLHLLHGSHMLQIAAIKLFPHICVYHYYMGGICDKEFVNAITKRLLVLAQRVKNASKNSVMIQTVAMEGLLQIFIELNCQRQLNNVNARYETPSELKEADILL